MTIDEIIDRLSRMQSESSVEVSIFVESIINQLKTMRSQIHRLASNNINLEEELRSTKKELKLMKGKASGRLHEINRLLEINNNLKQHIKAMNSKKKKNSTNA